MRFATLQVRIVLVFLVTVGCRTLGAAGLEPLAQDLELSDVKSSFLLCQPCPVWVLLLEILRGHLLTYKASPDNLPCRLWYQTYGFSSAQSC